MDEGYKDSYDKSDEDWEKQIREWDKMKLYMNPEFVAKHKKPFILALRYSPLEGFNDFRLMTAGIEDSSLGGIDFLLKKNPVFIISFYKDF